MKRRDAISSAKHRPVRSHSLRAERESEGLCTDGGQLLRAEEEGRIEGELCPLSESLLWSLSVVLSPSSSPCATDRQMDSGVLWSKDNAVIPSTESPTTHWLAR